MEKAIEARLLTEFGFTDDEINDFYTSFGDNKAAYEQRNSNTVDSLYSFIDFDRFKNDMIQMKKSVTNTEGNINFSDY